MATVPLRLALVGTGHIAAEHVTALKDYAERVQIVAASDLDAGSVEAFCRRHQIPKAYPDTDRMLELERPDLVLVSSPPFTHAALAIRAMEAGANVICEKPMVISLAEFDRIQEAELRTGRTCSSITQWRYGAAGKHVKNLIESGGLGTPLIALCNTLWYRPQTYYTSVPWRSRWSTEGGGVALGLGIHAMDLTLWLLGEWEQVTAFVSNKDRDVEVDTVAMAFVQFKNGAVGNFVNSAVSPRQNSYIRLDFQRATIEVDHLYQYRNEDWTFTAADDPNIKTQLADWQTIQGTEPGTLSAQWNALLDDYHHNQLPLTHISKIRPTYDFLASMYKSALTHQPIQRESIQPGDPFYEAMNGEEISIA